MRPWFSTATHDRESGSPSALLKCKYSSYEMLRLWWYYWLARIQGVLWPVGRTIWLGRGEESYGPKHLPERRGKGGIGPEKKLSGTDYCLGTKLFTKRTGLPVTSWIEGVKEEPEETMANLGREIANLLREAKWGWQMVHFCQMMGRCN